MSEANQKGSLDESLDSAWRDLKYSLRTLGRTRGFTAVAILTLALGIGANTAIFTLLDQILLRLLPVKNPQELVLLTMRGRHYGSNWGGNAISHPMFRDFAAHDSVFTDMFCRFPYSGSLSFNGRAERVDFELVSGAYFSTLWFSVACAKRIRGVYVVSGATAMHIHHRTIQQTSHDLPHPTKVVPFGNYGAGLWTSHPIGLVIVMGLLFMGLVGLPEARWFLALAVPAGAICGFFMWFLHRKGLAGR